MASLKENIATILRENTGEFVSSEQLAEKLGADTVAVTPECEKSSADLLVQNSPLPAVKNKTPIPLLVSRLPLAKGIWRSAENRAFRIEQRNNISYLYEE